MNRIFISYRWGDCKSDKDFIELVRVIEQSTGLTAFWDTRELRHGNFVSKLQEGVKSADIFMPVVTKSYLQVGKEGGRDEDKDFCLLEYATAVSAGEKIVPIFCGVDGNIITVSDDEAKAAAQKVLNLSYTDEEITILKKYLCSQNGVTIGNVDAEQISNNTERLCSIVFDTFCSTESDITFYKKHLDDLAERLNPIRIFGDFDDSGLTLGNSYVPLSFLRHPTEKERKENTVPSNADENTILTNLEKEKLAVIVGDAGQGKSSFVRNLTIQLAEQAKQNGLSRELFFPLYFECKNIERDATSSCDKFVNELAEKAGLSRPALDAVIRFGKPLYIFDAMDEIPSDQMDALSDAIYKHIYIQNNKSAYFLFTSRPGQRLTSGEADFSIGNNNESIVRKYSVKDFEGSQQELYISNLAKTKKTGSNIKDAFLQALRKKEMTVSDYRTISCNPFMLFAIFSTYTNGQELPENRFDAISRVIDDVIERDLKKRDYSPIRKKNIKEILGAVSCLFYQQRDMGKTPHASIQTPHDLAEKIYHLDDSDRDDRKLLNKCSEFFETSNLFDENGFRHEFLASTYAAYYLLFLMKSKVKKEKSPLEADAISSLKHDTDYWKGVTESLLCLIDRESEDSKIYIEPLIDELQKAETPDYDTLCRSVSQFVNHQPRAAALLLSGMLKRGCDGIECGEQTFTGFQCRNGANPYEELFYYPAFYPYLQQYLSNLTTGNTRSEKAYLCGELIREVCALFSDENYQKLQNVYNSRNGSTYPDIIKKLVDAAERRGRSIYDYAGYGNREIMIERLSRAAELARKNIHGYVRIRDGERKIGEKAFGGCTGLTDVTIPDSVTEIGAVAFSVCTGLTRITIPDSVTEIGVAAFNDCKGLTGITIPDSVTKIGSRAFSGCKGLTDITIPDGVTKIESGAFSHCTGMTRITIPDSVTKIGAGAFRGCTGLTSITIPDSLTEIGEEAFRGCTELTSITIPDSVTKTGAGAFRGCTGLTSITIPDSVTKIEEYAFSGCTGLTSITIPDSVTKIGEYAFSGCTGLTSVTIPDSVTKIGKDAFSGCTGLTSITIPDSVTKIEEYAFSGCTGLTDVTIPDSVTKIEEDAFSGCTGLTSITIPDSVTEIGWSAFSDCTGLTRITIPDSLTEIGEEAFRGCTGMTNINVGVYNPCYASIDGILFNKEKTVIISYPSGRTGVYTIPDSVTEIGVFAFSGCTGLTSITIPNSVTIIGEEAFSGCTGLTSITIPDSVKTIENRAFYDCKGLTCITIPDSVTKIGAGAFRGCTGLTSITIPDSVTKIGWLAFFHCASLTIYCQKDSYAETYAKDNNIPFVAD